MDMGSMAPAAERTRAGFVIDMPQLIAERGAEAKIGGLYQKCAGVGAPNNSAAQEHAADRPAIVPSVGSHTLRALTPAL
jgi:hypothetical protein